MIDVCNRKIGALAVHIQKAILSSRIEHRLPHGGVMRVRDVNDRKLDWGSGVSHFEFKIQIPDWSCKDYCGDKRLVGLHI